MSPRKILRIVLSVVVLVILWTRTASEWHDRSTLWLGGLLLLSVVLVAVVIFELTGMQRKWRRLRDQVPKKPLGLDT